MTFSGRVFLVAAAAALFSVGLNTNSVQAQSSFRVEVTNEGNTDFFTTPVWFGLHNGGFDFFDAGASTSAELEILAELGNVDPLNTIFEDSAFSPGDISGAVASASGVPPIAPGETASSSFTPINPSSYQYFSFASMLVPTNDTFFGNDDAMAYQIFDANDNFLGTNGVFEIQITAADIYDAGTEINDAGVDGGAAFAQGRTGTEGADENGVITLASASDLNTFAGLTTPNGFEIVDTELAAGEVFATIRIVAVPEPSSFVVLGLFGICGLARRRR